MRAPGFWQRNGLTARLLAPLSPLAGALTARRVARHSTDCGVPVLCIGNASVGGSGKTILTLDVLARYRARGTPVFALTRGHRGRLAGPVLVDPSVHDARDVGDEALLLAAVAPTIVARDRAAGAAFAVASGAAAIVMDDGLQNPDPVKTVSILVIDGGAGFGNGRTLPAGPLREPIGAAAARCDAAVLIGTDRHGARSALPARLPVLTARLQASLPVAGTPKLIGFAGIGRPDKFFETLRTLDADVIATIAFPDHHRYRPIDLARLQSLAARTGARLATTAKDAVKLPPEFRDRCLVIPVELAFDDRDALDRFLP